MESYIFSSDFFNIKYVINVDTLCTTFNAEPNRHIDLKKKWCTDKIEQSISQTSFLSWFKLDSKCNLAAGFCAVHNNPTVAKTWTLNRLGKSIWSYYWHFLSNLKNTWKPLVKPVTGWGGRHSFGDVLHGVWQTARSKLLRIHCALYNVNSLLRGWFMHQFRRVVER